jgi:hypothetical protein
MIEVRVVNHAQLPDKDLLPAQALAAKIFEEAGFAMRWLSEGTETETSAAGSFNVRLILLSGERAETMLSVERINDDVLGLASDRRGWPISFATASSPRSPLA